MADMLVHVSGSQWSGPKRMTVKVDGIVAGADAVAGGVATWVRVNVVEEVVEGVSRGTDSVTIYASLFQLEQLAKDILSGVQAARQKLALEEYEAARDAAKVDPPGVVRNRIF